MAIRTQVTDNVRRVITKVVEEERRVSCSCCGGDECCMYRAQDLADGLYTEEDLPDSLEGIINETRGTYTRNGEGYEATWLGDFGPFVARYEIQQDLDGSYRWQGLGASCACLFFCSDSGLTDYFPDELTRDAGGIGPAVRISLCEWCLEGDELNVGAFTVVYFDGTPRSDCNGRFFPDTLTPHRWYLAPVGDGFYRKTGDQNTPVGTYEAVNTPGMFQEIS